MRIAILVILIVNIFTACDSNRSCKDVPEVSGVEMEFEMSHLMLQKAETIEDVEQFLKNENNIARYFFEKEQYPHDSILAKVIFQKLKNPNFDTLFIEAKEVFGNYDELKEEFVSAFKFIKSYYPAFEAPKVKTMITGFEKDLYVSDSLIIIGVDYYLGQEATYRPIGLPQYILNRYRKEYIVPSCILLLSNQYNKIDTQDHTLLADMLFYGKAYTFAKAVLPCVSDSLLLGYTGEQVADINENVEIIWSHFIANELLYETSRLVTNKYVGERPKTFEIGEKCPGRIGAWLGWQIIQKYQDENNVSLPDIMNTSNSGNIFMQSKYKPNPR